MGKPIQVCEYCFLNEVTFGHGSISRQTGNEISVWADLVFDLLDADRELIREESSRVVLVPQTDKRPSASEFAKLIASSETVISTAVAEAKAKWSGFTA